MKIKKIILCLLIISGAKTAADEDICDNPANNFFISPYSKTIDVMKQEDKCKLESKNRAQSKLFESLENIGQKANLNFCFTNLNLDTRDASIGTDRSIERCQQIADCINDVNEQIKNSDDPVRMTCTNKFLQENFNQMFLENKIKNLFSESLTQGQIDDNLLNLRALLGKTLPFDELRAIKFCKINLQKNDKCLKNSDIFSTKAIMTLKYKVLSDYGDRNLSKIDFSKTQEFVNVVGNSHSQIVILNSTNNKITNEVNINNEDNIDSADIFKRAMALKREINGQAKIDSDDNVYDRLGVDLTSLKKSYNGKFKLAKTDDEIVAVYRNFIAEAANKVIPSACEKSIMYNARNLCDRLESQINIATLSNNNSMMELADYIDKQKSAENKSGQKFKKNIYSKISTDLIRDSINPEAEKKFNYAGYYNLNKKFMACELTYKDQIFRSKKDALKSQEERKKINERIEADATNDANESFNNFRTKLANSKDERKARMAQALNNIANDLNKNANRNSMFDETSNNSLLGSTKATDSIPKLADDAGSFSARTISNGLNASNGFNYQNGNNTANEKTNYIAPANMNSTVTNTYVPDNNANGNGAITNQTKQINELLNKQSALEKSLSEAESKSEETTKKSEIDDLQTQIADLKAELQKTKKEVAIVKNGDGRETTKTEENKYLTPVKKAVVDNYANPNVNYNNNYRNDYENINRIKNDDAKTVSNNSTAAGTIERSTPSAKSSAINSGISSNRSETSKGTSLVLTKAGEPVSDINKIVENPKETDLITMAEKSNGVPFLIRENGAIVEVQIKKDAKGKPVYVNGQPELIKRKLSKEAEAKITKTFNQVRESKTVRDTVRLKDLYQTTNEALK